MGKRNGPPGQHQLPGVRGPRCRGPVTWLSKWEVVGKRSRSGRLIRKRPYTSQKGTFRVVSP